MSTYNDVALQQGANTGLEKFWDAFTNERDRRQKMAMAQAQLAMQQKGQNFEQGTSLLKNNMTQGTDGAIAYNDLGKAQQGLLSQKTAQESASYDRNSDYSKNISKFTNSVVGKTLPGTQLPPGMPASEINSENGIVGKAITAGGAIQAGQMKNYQFGRLVDSKIEQNKIVNAKGAAAEYDKVVLPNEQKTYAANRALDLIGQIQNGTLKSTPQINRDLGGAMASMIKGGAPGEHSMDSTTLQSLPGSAQAFFGQLTGTAQNTVAPEQLEQMRKDIGAMRDNYATQHDQTYRSMREGLDPSLTDKTDARFNTFRAQNKLRGLGGPVGNQPPGQQSGAVDLNSLSDAELKAMHDQLGGK